MTTENDLVRQLPNVWEEEQVRITDGPPLHEIILSHQVYLAYHLKGKDWVPYYVSFSTKKGGFVLLLIKSLGVGRKIGELAFTASSQNVHCHSLSGYYIPRTRKGEGVAVMRKKEY
ncbi:MAG: hypothetical protein Q8Q36_02435 [bacterium]|nr:hypothetical protein [bacterium]